MPFLKKALTAAINFTEVACQQASYMVGRGKMYEEIQKFQKLIVQVFTLVLLSVMFTHR